MAAVLEVEELRTHIETPTGVVKAVDGISFTVEHGETVAVVGESGCGKSMTALSILRLLSSSKIRTVGGKIKFNGTDILGMSDKELQYLRGGDIGIIFQEPMTSLNPVLTIKRQLTESLELHESLSKRDADTRAIELLDLVGIPDPKRRLQAYPHEFSGGMQQRLMIAIAISCNPKLLIADEPTTALDVTVEAQVLELLEKLKKELGMGIILITHNLGIVARYAQRVNVMYAGKIVEQGSAEQVYGNPRHPYTRGLLSCVPRLDRAAGERRTTIPGAPPNLAHLGQGCAFMPRCSYATEQCGTAIPPLMEISDAHVSACWVRNELVEQTARAPLGLV